MGPGLRYPINKISCRYSDFFLFGCCGMLNNLAAHFALYLNTLPGHLKLCTSKRHKSVLYHLLITHSPLHCAYFHKDREKWRAFVNTVMNLIL